MAKVKLGPKGWTAVGVGAALALVIGVSATAAGTRASVDGARDIAASAFAPVSPSASPTPTPVVETKTVTETEPVPFAETTVEDANRDVGTSAVTTAGVAGVRTKTYRVTLTDGVEAGRELVSDTVTTAPVRETGPRGLDPERHRRVVLRRGMVEEGRDPAELHLDTLVGRGTDAGLDHALAISSSGAKTRSSSSLARCTG